MRRLFFTSPLDHRGLDDWPELAQAMRRDVKESCGRDVDIQIGDGPIFGYGTDVDEALAALSEVRLSRQVQLDLWSSIVHYAVVCVTLGPAVRRAERRALERRLSKRSLGGQGLLRTFEGPWFDDSGQVYGYRASGGDASARASIEHMLFPFDPPFYLGERWLLQGENEQLDDESFSSVTDEAPGLVTFLAENSDAEERVWENCFSGEGLFALFPDDPAMGALIRRFHQRNDLRIFLAEAPSAGMRVTLGRCQPEDQLVVAYSPPEPPEISQPLLFMI